VAELDAEIARLQRERHALERLDVYLVSRASDGCNYWRPRRGAAHPSKRVYFTKEAADLARGYLEVVPYYDDEDEWVHFDVDSR